MAKAGLVFQKKDEWFTPKEVVDFFGPFDYDPATTKELAEKFGIPYYDTIETDGLKRDWSKFKKIWINPPFTRKFEFLEKAVKTARENAGVKIFFLIPIETLTTMKFHEVVAKIGYTMWSPNGRIKFKSGFGECSLPAFGSVVLELKKGGKTIRHWRYNG